MSEMTSHTSPPTIRHPSPLEYNWTVWNHLPLPFETDWSINGYEPIISGIDTVEMAVGICKSIPPILIQKSMLYFTKSHINPLWEDKHNRRGGCFSYQIANNLVVDIWTKMCYVLVGNTLSDNELCMKTINGISVSPKKKFCIIKIWMSGCEFQDPNLITTAIPGLVAQGCLFKKHSPEY